MKLIATCAAFLIGGALPTLAQVHGTQCKVTLSSFNQLQTGMSYPDVAAKLGCDGVEISRTEMAGFTSVMFAWDGQGSLGANMNIMIQDGRLIMKSQFGLR